MGPGSSETLRKLFLAELNGEEARPTTVEVIMGRKLKVNFFGRAEILIGSFSEGDDEQQVLMSHSNNTFVSHLGFLFLKLFSSTYIYRSH